MCLLLLIWSFTGHFEPFFFSFFFGLFVWEYLCPTKQMAIVSFTQENKAIYSNSGVTFEGGCLGLWRTIKIPIQNDLPAFCWIRGLWFKKFPLKDKKWHKKKKRNKTKKKLKAGFITQSVACFLFKPVSSSKWIYLWSERVHVCNRWNLTSWCWHFLLLFFLFCWFCAKGKINYHCLERSSCSCRRKKKEMQ